MVREFHRHVGAPVDIVLAHDHSKSDIAENSTSAALLIFAGELRSMYDRAHEGYFLSDLDPRFLRAKMFFEEVAELVEGLANRDPLLVLDAIADIQYITAGTAVTFDLPLEKAFDEVHRSNMTKDGPSAATHSNGRGKGAGYKPPKLMDILMHHYHAIHIEIAGVKHTCSCRYRDDDVCKDANLSTREAFRRVTGLEFDESKIVNRDDRGDCVFIEFDDHIVEESYDGVAIYRKLPPDPGAKK